VTLRLATWNLQGTAGLDVRAVADALRERNADVVFLQEVTRRQSRQIGKLLGAASVRWTFKHWTVVRTAEGMATIGVSAPLRVEDRSTTHPRRLWSWRRRIVQEFDVDVDGAAMSVVHVHLSPHPSGAELRRREADALIRPDPSTMIMVGDHNEDPDGPTLRRLRAAGLHDAWTDARTTEGPGPTNWSGQRDRPADARIDFVLHGLRLCVEHASVPDTTTTDRERWAELSDHLPLTVVLSPAT
jgi:endonuclease/exonuclease/phosphatase family metal-dependent hydrolase